MSDTVDEARDAALDRAAHSATADLGGTAAAVGDLTEFLRAYYRRTCHRGPGFVRARSAGRRGGPASGPGRRPQGRALVRVATPARDAGPAPDGAGGPAPAIAAFGPVQTVVDIVTDDMPYLVDSVTMELNRHQADISLILHPRLVVRRDMAGGLHAVAGPVNGTADGSTPGELTESWMHIEIAGLGDRGAAFRARSRPVPGAGRRPGHGRGPAQDGRGRRVAGGQPGRHPVRPGRPHCRAGPSPTR